MPAVQTVVLFTDLVGSTELAAGLDTGDAEALRSTHFSLLRKAVATHGGTEVKNLGDGLMVAFASPSGALACAVAMQQNIAAHNRSARHPLAVRIGLSAGEATVEDGDYFGDPVVEAARLCARAEGGQILAADLVRANAGRRAVQTFVPVGELELKGLPAAVPTVEVAWAPLPGPAAGVPLPVRLQSGPATGFFGRHREAAGLASVFRAITAGDRRRVVPSPGSRGWARRPSPSRSPGPCTATGGSCSTAGATKSSAFPTNPSPRPSSTTRPGRRGLSRHGRAPRHQDAAPPLTTEPPAVNC